MRFSTVVTLVSLLYPFCVSAETHVRHAYSSIQFSRRSGDVRRILSSLEFARVHGSQKSLSCLLERVLPPERGGEFLKHVVSGLHLPEADVQKLMIDVTSSPECQEPTVPKVSKVPTRMFSIRLDAKNVPVSVNPVWNACVRGQGLSFDLIQDNVDRFVHRQGTVRKALPWTCRDYHRGRLNEWVYKSDGFDIRMLLNTKGEFLGILDDIPESVTVTIERSVGDFGTREQLARGG